MSGGIHQFFDVKSIEKENKESFWNLLNIVKEKKCVASCFVHVCHT